MFKSNVKRVLILTSAWIIVVYYLRVIEYHTRVSVYESILSENKFLLAPYNIDLTEIAAVNAIEVFL